MWRRKKVEGITIDLTRLPETGEFILEDLIVVEQPPIIPYKLSLFPEWVEELYNNPCSFCGAKYKIMHFDHINMFEKSDCVSSMVYRGCSKEDIMAEINKCQLLCVPCHEKVTYMERKYGFIVKKRLFNTLSRTGCDVEALRESLKSEYMAKMEGVYGELRGSAGK
jgi:hypothetical protein